jgi:hypothetical protein
MFSPYRFNPFNVTPLREVLAQEMLKGKKKKKQRYMQASVHATRVELFHLRHLTCRSGQPAHLPLPEPDLWTWCTPRTLRASMCPGLGSKFEGAALSGMAATWDNPPPG